MGKRHVARFSVTVSHDVLARFDAHTKRLGYKNRSNAVQDAMQSLITESKWMCETMGLGVGAIAMVYDPRASGLEEELTDLRQRFAETIHSTMHIHLDGENRLELIAVKGNAPGVRELAQELKTKRGVKKIELAIVTP
jgi:CopG family nickel-responsive transcriptional regulator